MTNEKARADNHLTNAFTRQLHNQYRGGLLKLGADAADVHPRVQVQLGIQQHHDGGRQEEAEYGAEDGVQRTESEMTGGPAMKRQQQNVDQRLGNNRRFASRNDQSHPPNQVGVKSGERIKDN